MALFIDGQISNLQDLERYESGLLDVASTEQIDPTAKMALAQDLIGADLLLFLLQHSTAYTENTLFTGQISMGRRRSGVSDVAVTEPLQRWHALRSIELIYQDAYNNQLNDRYKGKWQQYVRHASEAGEQLYRIGVGLVADPLSRAGAPLLIGVAGGSMAANYCVQITWVNRSGQEGEPSIQTSLQTVDSTQLLVAAPSAPATAVGWNVYVGFSPDSVSQQNGTPIPVGTDWTLPFGSFHYGRKPGRGQEALRYVVRDQKIQRG